jgi:hypothetical protein
MHLSPRPDKTLCDEAGIQRKEVASELLDAAITHGVVSEATTGTGFPKQLWVIDDQGRVFEAMYGGSKRGYYHGYPLRESDPQFAAVHAVWGSS